MIGYFDRPPPCRGATIMTRLAMPFTLIPVVMPCRTSWLRPDRNACPVNTHHGGRRLAGPPINLQHILYRGDERDAGIQEDDPLLSQGGSESIFSAPARSCYRGHGQLCSIPRPRVTAVAASATRVPLTVWNRPGRLVRPRRRHRKCAVWPIQASACRSALPQILPPPEADGFG